MAPSTKDPVRATEDDQFEELVAPQAAPWKYQIRWENVLLVAYIHLAGMYGAYLCLHAKWTSLLFTYIYYVVAVVGVTAGAHRLWSHKAFKATVPLRVLLMVSQSAAMQFTAMWWAMNHRMHHKYSDTDADPHNATRGFFFTHIGWHLVKRHPECVKRRKLFNFDDLLNDPVLKFQKKHGFFLVFGMSVVLPVLLPILWWGESFSIAWHLNMLRLTISHNSIWMINSFAHGWGNKPYDENIVATQNKGVSLFALGEGFHNYHHVFPWDYRAAELGNNRLNFTTMLIDLFSYIGWAYDLKTVPQNVIEARAHRTGDGTDLWGNKVDSVCDANVTSYPEGLNVRNACIFEKFKKKKWLSQKISGQLSQLFLPFQMRYTRGIQTKVM